MMFTRTLPLLVALSLAAPAAHAQPDIRAQAKRLLSKFNHEPTVVDVQRAAASYARVNPDAYDSWMSSARFAYLLPRKLQPTMRLTNGEDTDVRTTSSGTGSLSDLQSTDDEFRFELRAEWDLTRIVFNKDFISASRQIERLVNQREDILTTVNKLYFARRQLQVEREINPPGSVQKALRMQLRIDGLSADLDALTGGWFSKQIAKK